VSLRTIFKTAAQKTVTAFGDVGVSTNYYAFGSASYNASTGSPTDIYTTVAGVTVIFGVFSFRQTDGQAVQAEDKKALIPALSISGVTPAPSDRITLDGGAETWEVVRVETDPAEALWTLQVMRP